MARILVIEDNPDNLELMTYLLRAFGHDVLAAQDGAEGLATVHREALDLIVCDVHLPKLDGYEVARELKADSRLQCIPLLAVTALAMVGDRDKVLMAGFDLPTRAIREQISSALDLIVHVDRFRDGTRRISHITEVVGMEGDIITLQDIFKFDYRTMTLRSTGLRPVFVEVLAERGIQLPHGLFGAADVWSR